jgi:leucyl-tRNA synthetase
MGHVRNYVITDVIARVQRMRGDAGASSRWGGMPLAYQQKMPRSNGKSNPVFGQTAISLRCEVSWAAWVYRLIGIVRWQRATAITTAGRNGCFWKCMPAALRIKKDATVNWDPVDQTVLANEQVDADGRSWRSGALVEKRDLRQWFLRITNYADALLDDLDQLQGWPERVRTMQANWIGRSIGAEIDFQVEAHPGTSITVFTTRPDTLFGVSYLVLAPEHALVDQLTTSDECISVTAFRDLMAELSQEERTSDDQPKRGVPTGAVAINPANGESIPIWIADYVLADYGTGAVMGVPAHDVRDFSFARQHELPVQRVIEVSGTNEHVNDGEAWIGPGTLIHSAGFSGLTNDEAKTAITNHGSENGWARAKRQYRLRDWLISSKDIGDVQFQLFIVMIVVLFRSPVISFP